MKRKHVSIENGSKIAVIGGGPAGAFFAIKVLRRAKEAGKRIQVVIIEKKIESQSLYAHCPLIVRKGCNYCAGGLSPRMCDALEDAGIIIPEEIIQGNVTDITVLLDWKNIELKVPGGRKMLLVYRGSLPTRRRDRQANFDSYMLEKAEQEGAKVITGIVNDVQYSPARTPVVTYRTTGNGNRKDVVLDADFVVFAGGVNSKPGMEIRKGPLTKILKKLLPSYAPPKVRRALIFELEVEEKILDRMKGNLYFIEYGSMNLKIEMSSLVPKKQFLTVVLIGPQIDFSDPSENLSIIHRFMKLKHMKRLFPDGLEPVPVCSCNPNIIVGTAKNAMGHRVAAIGDMVASRLYKDGNFSAYLTATALADTIVNRGVDRDSLRKGYWPIIKKLNRDNRFGEWVFMLKRKMVVKPNMSRVMYQAVLTERKTKHKDNRRIEKIFWEIASGDNEYKNIFFSMFHPATVFSILIGGAIITIANYLAEMLFGLKWKGFERYPTGIYLEALEAKRQNFIDNLGMHQLEKHPDVERIYSIKIRATRTEILSQLGRFGNKDMDYFKARLIKVRRIHGNPNEVGTVIKYDIFPRFLSFAIILEKVIGERYLVYRVRDGFAKGGVLIFDIDTSKHGDAVLSVYIAFNFPKRKNIFKRAFWLMFRLMSPGFMHDVLWNHSLCKLKDITEMEIAAPKNS